MNETIDATEQDFNRVVTEVIRLTQYSHGAGCGCKISPKVLDQILHTEMEKFLDPHLLVGNESRDDAAVYDIGNDIGIISTTDFFMPIVDDAFTFGRIAATNAISDIYAMGGKPIMAIAILGFPISKLPPDVARRIVDGGRTACQEAGISLAGGHSIDAPEPIFGLAVTGIVNTKRLKRNNQAQADCELYLTKPLGIGILTTAEKKGKLKPEHEQLAAQVMCQLNRIGAEFSEIEGITAMTDVTGFGLLGHLSEICQGSNLAAEVEFDKVRLLDGVTYYIEKGCIPGGNKRNFDSYGHLVAPMSELQQAVLCDPQTSGGLLIAVKPQAVAQVQALAAENGVELFKIGQLRQRESSTAPLIQVI
ncbi:selenide, water dikinase SelD [Testudinibacter sp. TR-2022]|uniref:selenide, water dikinase SelD n=1 Tax=Testudinibacter sp. TR-2022 TaxID=2585029 RepID=UPI001118B0B2|nr:selenide, water dikinase SelD [Testudinibacter sp. TR-2022]TNH05652.1 selenide, water dikinase SelD [Pasteurellaceae bacterium Phil31]TNH08537.1 selenide, water dikinase SelD [Testudinibacter sp. TR-2022]TNH09982.1 selenide, water dikinase SelD [Testudinibacter sp. TR-2022]TNH16427.1 selenide, water dikinase SelD [Testudinibacter sp. TR-2022]TNH18411.1 selenide, water dikinase SelD [Testudinibacter sp. TR-2022]